MNKMEYPNVSEEELKLFIPSGIIVSGPSSSGKTELVLKILRNIGVLFDPSPKAIGREFYF
jgi:Ni2+-binding GTPase involved in maturation of urease and hydrogenase